MSAALDCIVAGGDVRARLWLPLVVERRPAVGFVVGCVDEVRVTTDEAAAGGVVNRR